MGIFSVFLGFVFCLLIRLLVCLLSCLSFCLRDGSGSFSGPGFKIYCFHPVAFPFPIMGDDQKSPVFSGKEIICNLLFNFASRAEVTSSSKYMFLLRRREMRIPIRCFSPPESSWKFSQEYRLPVLAPAEKPSVFHGLVFLYLPCKKRYRLRGF